MCHRRLTRCLVFPAFLLAAGSGCQLFHHDQTVPVAVRDAETHQPITGAEVRLTYPLAKPGAGPAPATGSTARDGTVSLSASPQGDAGIVLQASAEGYLGSWKNVSFDAVKPGAAGQGLVVDLYAGPRPTVELVVPRLFRGQVKLEVQVKENAPCTPGQRVFAYEVPAGGSLLVEAPPLFERGGAPEYRARYPDGTPLTQHARGDEVGFWWFKVENGCDYFVVGTERDYAAASSTSLTRQSGGGKGNGGGGSGRGRGGRRSQGGSMPPPQ